MPLRRNSMKRVKEIICASDQQPADSICGAPDFRNPLHKR